MSIYLNREAELAAVKELGEDIGFGRIIQLAHQCWDEMLEAKHGIKNHSEGWTLASADLIRERRAAQTSLANAGSEPSAAEFRALRSDLQPFAHRRSGRLRIDMSDVRVTIAALDAAIAAVEGRS